MDLKPYCLHDYSPQATEARKLLLFCQRVWGLEPGMSFWGWETLGMTRKPYPGDVTDSERAFVAPYLTLMREDASQRD